MRPGIREVSTLLEILAEGFCSRRRHCNDNVVSTLLEILGLVFLVLVGF